MKEVNNSGNNNGYDWHQGSSNQVPEGLPVPDLSNAGPSRPYILLSDLPAPEFPEIDPDVQRHADEALAAKMEEVRNEFLFTDPETGEPVPFNAEVLKWVEDKFRTINASILQDRVNRGKISPQTASEIRLKCFDMLDTLKQGILEPEIVVDVLLGIYEQMKDLFYYKEVKHAIQDEIGKTLGNIPSEKFDQLAKQLYAGPPPSAPYSEKERWEDAYNYLISWYNKFSAQ